MTVLPFSRLELESLCYPIFKEFRTRRLSDITRFRTIKLSDKNLSDDCSISQKPLILMYFDGASSILTCLIRKGFTEENVK